MTALQSSPSLASLLAPELLQEVLSQLPLRTVAAAATTCQGWKELALDILWKDVDLVDLLNVLAPTEERRRDDYGLALHFVRAITARDWSRFHNLAFRIRRGKLYTLLHSSLVAELYLGHPNRSGFLPAITHVDLQTEMDGHGLLFLGPTLDTLKLRVLEHSNTYRNEQLYTRITTSSPSIARITLTGFSFDVTEDIAALSTSLSNLRFIDVSKMIGMEERLLLSAFAGCRFLEEMVLYGNEQNMEWTSAVTEPFLNLRRLTVIDSTDPIFASFLNSLAPKLTHVQYGAGWYWQPDRDPLDLKVAVTAAARHEELESLVVAGHRGEGMDLSPRMLQPLYSCSRLRILSVEVDGAVELADSDIAQLVSHLPRLQGFSLIGSGTNDPFILPTLQALAVIVTSCPTIRTISLRIDTSLAQRPPGSNFQPSSSLRCVDVQHSYVDAPRSVALFLHGLSTSKAFELIHGYGEDEDGAAWDEVKSLLQEGAGLRSEVSGHNSAA